VLTPRTSGKSYSGKDPCLLLRRAAELSMALPNHAAEQYRSEIAKL
jgi:hypothetical protein